MQWIVAGVWPLNSIFNVAAPLSIGVEGFMVVIWEDFPLPKSSTT
jgi:hypothetical protein